MKKYILAFALLGLTPHNVFAAPAAVPDEIDEIIVSATLAPKASGNLTSAHTILTAKDLAARGQIFLADALRFVPGAFITQEGGAGALSAVRLRGAEANHTKVFIDGVEANPSGGQFDFGALLVSQIARVEIVRGGQSLVSGPGAIGGAIYITTKNKGGADWNLSAGSFGTFNVAGSLGGSNEQGFTINFGGEFYRTTGHDISTAGRSEKDGYVNGTINAKVGFDRTFGAHQVKAQLNHRFQKAALDGDDFISASNPDEPSNQNNTRNETGLSFAYLGEIGANLGLRVNFQGQHLATDLIINKGSPTQEGRTAAEAKVGVDYKTGRLALSATALGGWEINRYFRPPSHAFGAADSFETTRHVAFEVAAEAFRADLTAGVRYQHYSHSANIVLWQAGVGYKPHGQEFVRLRASVSTSTEEPSQTELYGLFPKSFIPNPHLTSERALTLDGGFDLDFSPLLKRTLVKSLSVSATGFALLIENEIVGYPMPINKVGTAKRRGGETSLQLGLGKVAFVDELTLAATYTYTRAERADGVKSLNRPKHVASVSLHTRAQQFSFDWDLSWQSNQQAYNGRIGSYPLVNVQLGFAINDSLNLFVRGENLTNQKTANAVGYQRRGAGVYVGLRGNL